MIIFPYSPSVFQAHAAVGVPRRCSEEPLFGSTLYHPYAEKALVNVILAKQNL